MSFYLISSNRVERLKDQLAQSLTGKPLASPFAREHLLVPSMPMKRWLGIQLALSTGINCNIDYQLPASWLWRLVSSGLNRPPQPDPLSRDQMAWKVFDLLPSLVREPKFAALNRYLGDSQREIRQWQLAGKIADLFDRYQYYRPELIRQWGAGGDDRWQAILWRALQESAAKENHRVALIDRWLEQLPQLPPEQLPERVSIFAVSSLPPLLLQVIQAIASRTDVYLYYLTPTDQYWADLRSAKQMARIRLEKPEEEVYFETGHHLLASWGKQGQVFQDLLLSDASLGSLELDCSDRVWPPTLLGNLQRDMFELSSKSRVGEADSSLQLHVCHSALRECQVLHDALLRRLDDDPSLRPEDILVMVPEINRYAPYIEAVFSRDVESRPFIPWNISDISVADEHPVIRAFLQLLRLPESRFALSEILSILDTPEICARFGLNADALVSIRSTLEQLNVRWGIDGTHREQFDVPGTEENSWLQAEERLMAGYAMGDAALWNGIAPYGTDFSEISAMCDFWRLLDRLDSWRRRLEGSHTGREWQELLLAMLDELFFENNDRDSRLQHIRETLADFAGSSGDNAVSLQLVRYRLERLLAERESSGRYFSGGVSFCGMRPMRSLPFRVICLLGMQDAAFPGREHPLEFDVMADSRLPGDPRKGEMDRYLLLETLLCARNALHISYTGRSIRDNSECQPSVLIRELFDGLERQYGRGFTGKITTLHPLQPFSAGNFGQLPSFDRYWCSLANSVAVQPVAADSIWPETPVESSEETTEIELGRLIRFARHPVRYFCNTTLGIYLGVQQEVEDDEPFGLQGLEGWQVNRHLLDDYIGMVEESLPRLKAEGMLPHGAGAVLALEQGRQKIAGILPQLEEFRGMRCTPRAVDLPLAVGAEELRLTGQVSNYYEGRGLMHFTASKFSGKWLMPFWLEYLALCATGTLRDGESAILVSADRTVLLPSVAVEQAREYLAGFVALYFEGRSRPLQLFPAASWLCANGKSESAILSAWNGNSYSNINGDSDDAYIQFIARGASDAPVTGDEFRKMAESFYGPALAMLEGGK